MYKLVLKIMNYTHNLDQIYVLEIINLKLTLNTQDLKWDQGIGFEHL